MEITSEEMFLELIKNEKVLVDFYATWCGPCKMMHPVLETISNSRSEVKVVKVDVDKFENLAKKYGVMSIPTLILFENGELIDKKIGFTPANVLNEWIS